MKRKQFLAVLLALCMTLGTLPMTAFAAEDMPPDEITEMADEETKAQEENEPAEEETDVTDTAKEETDGDTIDADETDTTVCTRTEDCTAAEHEADCPKADDENIEEEEHLETKTEELSLEKMALLRMESGNYDETIPIGENETYTSLQAALEYINISSIGAGSKVLIQLQGDTKATSGSASYTYLQEREGIEITIDLNGHTLEKGAATLYFGVNGSKKLYEEDWEKSRIIDITIMDSSTEETGTCKIPFYLRYGKLTILSGNYESSFTNTGGKLTIEDGFFEYKGSYLIQNVVVLVDTDADGNPTNGDVDIVELAIHGGTFQWENPSPGSGRTMITTLINNKTAFQNVTITGGRFICNGGGAIKFSANVGNLSISGEDTYFEMTNTKNSPLISCAGDGSIEGGTFLAYGNKSGYPYNGDLVLDFHKLSGNFEIHTDLAEFNITGGTFDGRIMGADDDAVMNISSGTFQYTSADAGNCDATYALIYSNHGCTMNITGFESISVPQINDDNEYNYKFGAGDYGTINLKGVELLGENRDDPSGGILIDYNGEAVLEDCVINGNSAGYGGGIQISSGSLEIKGTSEITGNSATGNGGGIYMWDSLLEVGGNTEITGNSATYGGGIYARGVSEISIKDGVIFCNNTTTTNSCRDIWCTGDVTSVSLPDAAGMNQIYLADGKGRIIDGWYKDFPAYTPSPDGNPYDYSNDIGKRQVYLVASYKDTPLEAEYYIEHYQQQPDGTYTLHTTETLTGTIGSTVTITADTAQTYPNYHINDTAADAAMSGEIPSTGTLTLKLYYDLDTHNVTFDLNGGKGDDTLITAKHGQTITLPPTQPTRSGYKFQGWKDETTGMIYQPGDGITVTNDMTLVAQWKKKPSKTDEYRLHFESNGGTRYSDEWYEEGTKVSLDKVPKRSGYEFTGWYADEELEDKIKSVTMNTDKTVYAGWKKIKDSKPDGDNGDQQDQKPTDVPQLNKEDHFAYVSGYPEGDFRPERNMTRAEVAVMFSNLLLKDTQESTGYGNTFTDVAPSEWYYDRVGYMEQFGIISGYPDGSFRPNAPITRAEFATIAAKFDELKETGHAAFTDLPDNHWGKKFIEMAYNRGWISGYPDGTVKPDKYITRAEVVSVTNRILERVCDQAYIESHKASIKDYFDITNAHWAYYHIMEASNGHLYAKGEQSENWISLNP